MGLYKQLIPDQLKFTPATDLNWTRIETLIHGPGASEITNAVKGGDANSAVFACLMAIAFSFTEAPVRVFRGTDEDHEHLPEHPLQKLLDNPTPNGELNKEELWFWTAWATHTDGNAYWLKVRAGGGNGRTGNVLELWPISPTRMVPKSEGNDWISYYKWEFKPNEFKPVPVENVVHFRLGIDDRDHRRGLSPLKRLVRHISTDEEAEKFTDALLKNYAVPGLVVVPRTNTVVTEDQAERISNTLRRKFGTDQRGNIAVLSKEADVHPFGFSPEELNLTALHRVPEERIAAVLRVPAIVAGLGAGLERSTYANFREAREMFTETNLVPMWRWSASKINSSLKPDFTSDSEIACHFHIATVRALQEDQDKKYARLNIGVQGQRPWITVNEARTDVGLPPVPDGDELTQPVPEPLRDEDQESGEEEDEGEDEKRRPFGKLAFP